MVNGESVMAQLLLMVKALGVNKICLQTLQRNSAIVTQNKQDQISAWLSGGRDQ